MHEVALAQGILDVVLDVAAGRQVQNVRVRAGDELAGDGWQWRPDLVQHEVTTQMCLILPSQVVAITLDGVVVELADGQRAPASAALKPDLVVGDYVLVDRGLVVETIDAQEAEAILSIYREIGDLLEAEDALP